MGFEGDEAGPSSSLVLPMASHWKAHTPPEAQQRILFDPMRQTGGLRSGQSHSSISLDFSRPSLSLPSSSHPLIHVRVIYTRTILI